jgi:hypothetical protein
MSSIGSDSLEELEEAGNRLQEMISSYSPEELAEMDREITLIAAHLEEGHSSIPFYQENAAILGKQYWRDLAEDFYH